MKPFNLERALAGDPVLFSDRSEEYSKVAGIHPYDTPTGRMLLIVVESNSDFGIGHRTFWLYENSELLFMAPVKRTLYYASFAYSDELVARALTHMYFTKEDAEEAIRNVFPLAQDVVYHTFEIEE